MNTVVATRDLERGTVVAAADLAVSKLPSKLVPKGAFDDPQRLVGRVVADDVLEGEVVRQERLGMSAIPPGMRVVSVPRHGSLASTRSTVDLWWTPPGPDARPCALLQQVLVRSSRPDRLELLVPVAEVHRVLLPSRAPSFRVAVRNDLDVGVNGALACP